MQAWSHLQHAQGGLYGCSSSPPFELGVLPAPSRPAHKTTESGGELAGLCTRTTVRVQKHGGEPWIARNKAGLCRETPVSQHKVGFVGTNRGMRARTQACAHLPRWMRAHPGSGATTGVCMHAHGSRSAFVQVNTGVYKSCVRSHPLCSSETTRCGLVPLHRSRLPQHSTLVLWHQTQVLAHRTQVPPHHTPVRLFASLGGL